MCCPAEWDRQTECYLLISNLQGTAVCIIVAPFIHSLWFAGLWTRFLLRCASVHAVHQHRRADRPGEGIVELHLTSWSIWKYPKEARHCTSKSYACNVPVYTTESAERGRVHWLHSQWTLLIESKVFSMKQIQWYEWSSHWMVHPVLCSNWFTGLLIQQNEMFCHTVKTLCKSVKTTFKVHLCEKTSAHLGCKTAICASNQECNVTDIMPKMSVTL